MISKILKHKAYIFYTFFKYVEYGILAFIFMSFANLVSPEAYGSASLGFQVVTYSGFIVLGVNQVLLKRYSLEENETLKHFYLQYNVIYNVCACIVAVILVAFMFQNVEYAMFLAILCGVKLILESSVAINRVKGKMANINIIYLSYSILFIILYFVFVTGVLEFFKFWSLSIVFGAIIGVILSIAAAFKSFNLIVFKENFKKQSKLLFNDGLKLALIALISPLFSTLNIIFLNVFDIDKEVIGNFQLADNIANVVSLGGASILFIIFPDVIKQISKDSSKINTYYKAGFKWLLISIVLLLALYYPVQLLLKYFFPEYVELPYLILFTLISRLLILLLFIPNSVWITFSKEAIYIKASLSCVVAMGVIFTVFLQYANNVIIYRYFLFFQIIALLFIHIYLYKKTRKVSL